MLGSIENPRFFDLGFFSFWWFSTQLQHNKLKKILDRYFKMSLNKNSIDLDRYIFLFLDLKFSFNIKNKCVTAWNMLYIKLKLEGAIFFII